jgi:hypothetical protein
LQQRELRLAAQSRSQQPSIAVFMTNGDAALSFDATRQDAPTSQ